jgi:hypothetical protein
MTTIDRKTATPSVAGNSVEVNSDPRASGRPITSRAKPARSRRLWRAAILAPAVVVGTMLLAAPTAFADKSQVQIDCEKAGGTYTQNSASSETCCFKTPVDNNGHYCKEYIAGEFVGVSRTGAVNPPGTGGLHPVQPPPATVGPLPVMLG